MNAPMTDEMLRILIAVDEGRMFMNRAGRWEIDYEERPERRSRDLLRGRGLIISIYNNGPSYRITAKGKTALRAELDKRIAARRGRNRGGDGLTAERSQTQNRRKEKT